jgi:transcriptional regulator with XRE-family HTH domain
MTNNYITLKFRKRFGWSQRILAEKSGISINAIKNWESGKTRTPNWVKFILAAIAFNLPGYGDNENK